MSIKAGILNVTGYGGAELARILAHHPQVELRGVTGRSHAGKPLATVFPHLASLDLQIGSKLEDGLDVVFSALPHAASAEAVLPYVEGGARCIDLSADFRLDSAEEYAQWYGGAHPAPERLAEAVYGLPELNRQRIKGAVIVANPGCFCVGAILGMAPALKAGIVEPEVVNDSKTGVSGAGRQASVDYGFSELAESVKAYGLGGHRHGPEIAQELTKARGGAVDLLFVPHLVPMSRGILGTNYARLTSSTSSEEVMAEYRKFYDGEPFVDVVSEPPATKHARGTNKVLIHPVVRGNRLVVVTALDNLVKGAAGIAVQNMNIMFALPEPTALTHLPLYP